MAPKKTPQQATVDIDKTQAEAVRPIVLLDTNTIQHALGKATGPQLSPLLQELTNDFNATLAISDIVIYESLKSKAFKQKHVEEVTSFMDDKLTRYLVDHEVLISAAQLYDLYAANKEVKMSRDSFSIEDIIIAATAYKLNAYILTSDCNDFPRPYFTEVYKNVFYYEESGRSGHFIKYLFQPDFDVLQAALAQM